MKVAGDRRQGVLIVAPTGEDASILRDVLANDGLMPCVCESIEKLCEGIDGGAGTAIIAEEAFSNTSIGLLIQTIQRQPEWSDFPFVIMAIEGTDPDRAWALMSGGNQPLNASVLVRPVLTRTLLAAVRASLRSRNAQFQVAEELQRRKEAEAALTIANEESQAFSYSVSHDLRAPLLVVKSFSTLLIEDYSGRLDETGRSYLNSIVRSADQMNKLIEDMLNLSRISRLEMTVQDVNLSALAEGIFEELQGTQPKRQVDITVHQNLRARGDEHLLKIAITNLLGNAWKYTSKNPQPSIEFGSFQKDNQQVFFVRDNGAGFPMRHIERLFKPFQRLHSGSDFSGNGIGLAIVHRVILRHSGQIWAEGEEGKGATFFFTLQ